MLVFAFGGVLKAVLTLLQLTCEHNLQAIFLKPILLTLSAKLGDKNWKQVPYFMATQSARIINDHYNALLANAGSMIEIGF
jgi:hypothetical protein